MNFLTNNQRMTTPLSLRRVCNRVPFPLFDFVLKSHDFHSKILWNIKTLFEKKKIWYEWYIVSRESRRGNWWTYLFHSYVNNCCSRLGSYYLIVFILYYIVWYSISYLACHWLSICYLYPKTDETLSNGHYLCTIKCVSKH